LGFHAQLEKGGNLSQNNDKKKREITKWYRPPPWKQDPKEKKERGGKVGGKRPTCVQKSNKNGNDNRGGASPKNISGLKKKRIDKSPLGPSASFTEWGGQVKKRQPGAATTCAGQG